MKAQTQKSENYPLQDETFTWEDEPEPNYSGDFFEVVANLCKTQAKEAYDIDIDKTENF